MAPILLKTKGVSHLRRFRSCLTSAWKGKTFGTFSSLSDVESLQLTWKVSSKVASHLDCGERIENLSWRLWHLRDVMVDVSIVSIQEVLN